MAESRSFTHYECMRCELDYDDESESWHDEYAKDWNGIQREEQGMQGSGQITFGGVAFAAMSADITLADGTKWHFSGYIGEIGTPNVGYGNFSGDFPGTSHMAGSCALEIVDGGIGPGGAQITWYDLHGQIGTVLGYVFGGGADFGLGGGTWTETTGDALSSEQERKLDAALKELHKG